MKKKTSFSYNTIISSYKICIVLWGIIALLWVFNKHQIFHVRNIVLKGATTHITNDLIPQDLFGLPMLGLSLDDISKKIYSHPWVHSVIVKRFFPSTLYFYIKEQKPIGILSNKHLYYINDEGYSFKKIVANDNMDYILFTGFQINDSKKIQKALSFLHIINKNGIISRLFKDEISEINFHPIDGYSVFLLQKGIKIIIGLDLTDQIFVRLNNIYQDIENRKLSLAYVKLNFKDRAIVGLRSQKNPVRGK